MSLRSTEHGRRSAQRRSLSIWLGEWQVHRMLVDASAGDLAVWPALGEEGLVRSAEPAGNKPAGRRPAAGQIRLLRPGVVDLAWARPVYVVLLRRHGAAAWLAAPFGPFSCPAVPGEWRMGRRAVPWAVLCLWNARIVPDETAATTWFCGRIAAARTARALDLWERLRKGASLDPVLARQVGPPLAHPLDPRHAYLQEERELLDEHLCLGEVEESRDTHRLLYERDTHPAPLRRAAEEEGEYRADERE